MRDNIRRVAVKTTAYVNIFSQHIYIYIYISSRKQKFYKHFCLETLAHVLTQTVICKLLDKGTFQILEQLKKFNIRLQTVKP